MTIIQSITIAGKEYFNVPFGGLSALGVTTAQINLIVFDQTKIQRLAAIKARCQLEIGKVTESYSAGEVLTFDQQKKEAQEYTFDPTSPTPAIDIIALESGIDKVALVNNVLDKAALFEAAVFKTVGKRKRLTAQLKALSHGANTMADIEAVTW